MTLMINLMVFCVQKTEHCLQGPVTTLYIVSTLAMNIIIGTVSASYIS